MNRVEIVGGLTNKVDFRYLGDKGTPMALFTLAVGSPAWSRDQGDFVSTSFISCQAWGHQAESLAEADPTTGEKIYVLGELDQSSYEDREGKRVSKTRVRVTYWIRLSPKADRPPAEPPSDPDEAPF